MKKAGSRGWGSEVGGAVARRAVLFVTLAWALAPVAQAQKWINPNFDAHRLDYRDLGYPDVSAIDADDTPITALITAPDGAIYGATSGKSASHLFLYDRAINKVRPLGRIGDARGVYHTLVMDRDGTILIGGGRSMLVHVKLTQDFPGGFRAVEEQLWKDVAAPYADYAGGHLYRYNPATGDVGARLPSEACPLEDLGVPVKGNTIYAVALDAQARRLYGVTYPDARFFVWDLKKNKTVENLPLIERKIYSGPERQWRSVPRALSVASDGRVYTSGEDGRVIYYDPAVAKIKKTDLQVPGEYYEAWNYYGYPVLEAWAEGPDNTLYGATTDGYLFRLNAERTALVNLGKPRLSRRVRGMTMGPDNRLYMLCGEFEEPCKLFSYGLDGVEGFCDWGALTVDRSPYYAKRAYQFDAMTTGLDGTLFLGESERRACLYLFIPGARMFPGGFNPKNPR